VIALASQGGSRKLADTKKVAVLKGGRSLEHGVSLRSGAQVLDALQRLGHDAVAIDASSELVAKLRAAEPDAAFIAMHGGDGEDGTVQELLEAVDVRYTGSGPAACIQCSDKVLAKHLMRAAGIPTPDFHSFSEGSFKQLGGADALGDVGSRLGFPLVVKPACQGSALGVKFARSAAELPGALVAAFSYDRKVVLERYVKGRDLAVSVLDPPTALPVVEAVPRDEDFYDFESRYLDGLIGPLPEADALYAERAPVGHVTALTCPVLLLQGLDDPIVPPAQSESIAADLAAHGIRYAYLAFAGESHGFRKAETIIASLEAEVSFYGQIMGFTPPGIPPVALTGGG